MIHISEEEIIYFPKIKEYFREVVTSYEIGNYRSAIVMLYSVIVCDMLLKLEELVNTNNDGIAKEILVKIKQTREENQTSSRWEWELIESVRKKTSFLDNESYANIQHLYAYRNMCAHPAVNDSFELYQPNKETTIAFIKNTLITVLVKPPIYIKKVFDTLVEDIANKKDIYVNDPTNFKVYLDNVYYSKMSLDMKLKTAKALWKFVFVLEDDDCTKNRRINYWALIILSSEIEETFAKYIKENSRDFGVSSSDNLRKRLVRFLSKETLLWDSLSEEIQFQIKDIINKDDNCKALAWFLYKDGRQHLNSIESVLVDKDIMPRVVSHYKEVGLNSEVLDFCINFFGNSMSFDTANNRFNEIIAPNLTDMTGLQLSKLVEKINENDQLNNRWNARKDNSYIVHEINKKIGEKFDFSSYSRFVFSNELVDEIEREERMGDSQ